MIRIIIVQVRRDAVVAERDRYREALEEIRTYGASSSGKPYASEAWGKPAQIADTALNLWKGHRMRRSWPCCQFR